MKHAEVKAGLIIAPTQATLANSPARSVVVDDSEYLIQLKPSTSRTDHRFETKYYAVIERPGQWHSVVPAPPMVRDVNHLWYRELIELVTHARCYVNMRRPAA